jgi:hypothetical protein
MCETVDLLELHVLLHSIVLGKFFLFDSGPFRCFLLELLWCDLGIRVNFGLLIITTFEPLLDKHSSVNRNF